MRSQFVERLREEQERMDLSHGDAALLAGVSREMWQRYLRENGAMPNAEVLLRLQGHGWDINYVLGGSRTLSDATLSSEERVVIECYRITDDDGRAHITRAALLERGRVLGYAVHEPQRGGADASATPSSERKRRGS